MANEETRPERDISLFPLTLGLTLFALVSFGLAALGSPIRRTRYTPLVSIHAVLMSAWLVLLCVQARLAHGGDLALHRRLGRASGWLVAALVPLSAVVTVDFHREFGRTGTLVGDFGLLIIFVPLYISAIWYAKRGRIGVHKRLLLISTIAMISPALGRFTDIVGLPRPAAVPMYLLMLTGVPLTYDLISRGRPHRASLVAIGVALIAFVAAVVVAIATGEL